MGNVNEKPTEDHSYIGQHRSSGGGAPNSGIKTIVRNPNLGKEAVPASSPSADISSTTGAAGKE
jgi:hypothetical protein